ncbi:Transcription elongation factor 1 [Penicillium paradoxum]|uniref:Transcription elongation factor 1 n=1 Tax=Penicillium paradoxum TaxID=176176 RepID=UPI002546DEAB|nr:Transcription elongation factor 1 [Penicillium paradoxum]KAJ5787429.1 Transcription elongation factor 1 [Penicillium paradoxum]
MGKRKKSSSKPQGPKKREPLPTSFSCLFCNHENSVIVKLDKKLGLGDLSCKVCGQKFQTGINCERLFTLRHRPFTDNALKDLSAPVDVYSDWVDACDTVAKDTANQYDPPSLSQSGHRGTNKQDISDDIGHGDIFDDDY